MCTELNIHDCSVDRLLEVDFSGACSMLHNVVQTLSTHLMPERGKTEQ